MEKGLIFNIQKFSIHDGGGIRTIIFMMGCPLRCPWCSNPESMTFETKTMISQSKCIACSSSSPWECRMPNDKCPTNAKTTVGRWMSVDEVMAQIEKDRMFYESTGGGLTLSGGEPLLQSLFAIELLNKARNLGINTAIETTGNIRPDIFREALKYVDTVLFDMKIMDAAKASKILGADNSVILDNFRYAAKEKSGGFVPRIPLVQGFTDNAENLKSIIELLEETGCRSCHLLPFHQFGSSKYKALGMEYALEGLSAYPQEQAAEIAEIFSTHGIDCVIGGI